MKILLVDDNPEDREHARRELSHRGHELLCADNGHEALDLFRQHRPDVVVTDIYMPGMDGFALTLAVQECAAPQWQPVIFLSGHRDDALQIKALKVGADAYAVKPVTGALLEAKLAVIQRLLTLQRQSQQRADELERYYASEERDKKIAQHLITRLVNAEKLNDPVVRHWVAPTSTFSGDLVAAARTPGGTLHILLADGTGHGLSASINVLPITAPFYAMTEKGFGIDAIARELNDKVRQFLPPDRFVAATIASVDFRENIVRVWNGGNPEPLILNPSGHAQHVFESRHVPLGILSDEEFEVNVEAQGFQDNDQFICFSDGLLEAMNGDGHGFGLERLAQCLVNSAPELRLEGVMGGVRDHLGDRQAHDDISFVVVTCRPGYAPAQVGSSVAESVSPAHRAGTWRFSLRLSAVELREVDVVPLLLNLVGRFRSTRELSGQLFMLFAELFNNALDHGLLGLDSRLKLGNDGMSAYLAERGRRLAGLEEGEIEFSLEKLVAAGKAWLRVTCSDSGPGFDHQSLMTRLDQPDEKPFGRGLGLVMSIGSSCEFNAEGNEVRVLLDLTTAAGAGLLA
jgi:two-component system, HptB-dependent secretion and biofilm response regulator